MKDQINISLNPRQLELAELIVTVYIEYLAALQRESTYSKIMENHWKVAKEIREILREAKQK